MAREVILNESGQRAGETGKLRDVYTLGSFDPSFRYFIEIGTLEQSEAAEPVDDLPEGAAIGSGSFRLPVRSVGRIGRRFFFAADLRFVNWPGCHCVFPEIKRLGLDVQQANGKTVARLMFDEYSVFESKGRNRLEDAIEELAAWADRQTESWELPPAVEKARETLRSDQKPNVSGLIEGASE